jgi:hypothetical protein
MVISYCVPCHQRQADLARAWPFILAAAGASPPVEVLVVDYGNPDPLVAPPDIPPGVSVSLPRYVGRDYYHMAHARNLSVKAATGEYVVITCADILPTPGFFAMLRERLDETQADVLVCAKLRGVLVCARDKFLAVGGFDERFEFYGPEDKDLEQRLRRTGWPVASYPSGFLDIIPTSDAQKTAHYRLAIGKRAMHQRGLAILHEHQASGGFLANVGQPWGQWDG